PLHHAAAAGQAEVVRLLIGAGADVNAQCCSDQTPLIWACNGGHLDVARMLLEAGADPNKRNPFGYTAYGRIPNSSPDLMRLLEAGGGRLWTTSVERRFGGAAAQRRSHLKPA